MSSACLTRVAGAGVLALGLGACSGPAPPAAQPPNTASAAPLPEVSHLYPGGASQPQQPSPDLTAFQNDAAHIADGKRYYTAYNCAGCHFNGGGGIGPSLMDQTWRYGGSLEEIHNSIAEGRPNGMPVWGYKIPDPQIWEIAAYVHSLSTPNPKEPKGASDVTPPPPNLTKTSQGGQQSG